MKKISLIITFLLFFLNNCIDSTKNGKQEERSSEKVAKKLEDQKSKTHKFFLVYENDTLFAMPSEKFDSILKNELAEIPKFSKSSPDSLYQINAYNTLNYGSEQGKDLYYLMYASYLSLNDNDIPIAKKKELEGLFYSINLFFETNIGLGSGFNHMSARIPAYANYELLDYDPNKNLTKPNKIEKEKFIKQLQRQVTDKTDRTLPSLIEDIDEQIDTDFKLKKAKYFLKKQYGHLLK